MCRTEKFDTERCSQLFILCFLIGSLIVSLVMTLPVWFSPSDHVTTLPQLPSWLPGDSDVWLFIWNMWWVWKAQTDADLTVWETSYLFHPHIVSLRFHSLTPLNSYIGSWMYRLIGNWILVYNFLYLSTFVCTMLTMFLLLHHVSGHRFGAVLGSFSFTFCSYHMLHGLQHLNLASVQFLPLTAYFFLCYLEKRSWWWLLSGVLSVSMNLLSSFYYGVLVIMFLSVFGLFRLLFHQGTKISYRELLVRVTIFLCLSSVFLGVGVTLLFSGVSLDEYVPMGPIERSLYSADILSWLLPNPLHPLWGNQVREQLEMLPGNIIEKSVSPGYVVLFMVVIGSVLSLSRRYGSMRPWLLTALLFIVLSFGPQLTYSGRVISATGFNALTPYRFFDAVPFLDHFRAPSRFSVIALLCFSVILCEVTAILCRAYRSKPKPGVHVIPIGVGVLVGGLLFEIWSVPLPVMQVNIPHVYQKISQDSIPGAVMEVPLDPSIRLYQLYQTVHQRPLLSGYLARFPGNVCDQFTQCPVLSFFSMHRTVTTNGQPPQYDTFNTFLESRHIRYLIVHREYLSSTRQTDIISFLAQYRHAVVEQSEGIIVYRFPAAFNGDAERGEVHATDQY